MPGNGNRRIQTDIKNYKTLEALPLICCMCHTNVHIKELLLTLQTLACQGLDESGCFGLDLARN